MSKVYGDSLFVLATSDQDSTWKIGDTVQIGDETLTIAGLLKNDPFSEDGLTNGKLTLITSGETFIRLTGNDDYSLVLIQTAGNVTDENVQAIQNSVDKTYSFGINATSYDGELIWLLFSVFMRFWQLLHW